MSSQLIRSLTDKHMLSRRDVNSLKRERSDDAREFARHRFQQFVLDSGSTEHGTHKHVGSLQPRPDIVDLAGNLNAVGSRES